MSLRRAWTPEQDAILARLVARSSENLWSKWAEDYDDELGGKSATALRKRWTNYLVNMPSSLIETIEATEDTLGEGVHHLSPEFIDKKNAVAPDWRKLLEHAERGKELEDEAETTQRTAKIRLQGPCAITWNSCWHLGDVAVNYKTYRKHLDLMMDTPNLYMVGLGDERQNMRQFRVLARVLDQVLSPRQQARLMEGLVMELTEQGKLLGLVGGNHDAEMDERLFGEELNAYIYANAKCPRFPNRADVDIEFKFGDRKHIVPQLWFHKSRFRSIIHALHGNKREYQFSKPAKIVAGGHDHTPGIEYYWRYGNMWKATQTYGGLSILLKASTFQSGEYGWQYWGDTHPPMMPTVVFSEDPETGELDMVAYPKVSQAVRALKQGG